MSRRLNSGFILLYEFVWKSAVGSSNAGETPCSSWRNAEKVSNKSLDSVTPAKAGGQEALNNLDCGYVRNDAWVRTNTNAPEKVSSDSPNELICQYCSDFIVTNNSAFEIIR